MKKTEVHIGRTYVAKASGNLVHVRIVAENDRGGWDAENLATGRRLRIKSAQRLRSQVPDEDGMVVVVPCDAPAAGAGSPPANPDQCACGQPADLTYLGDPRCSACYEKHCDDQHEREEHVMATKTKSKRAKTKAPKASSRKAAAARGKVSKAPKKAKPAKAAADGKPMSGLDAAANVLAAADAPMNAKDLIQAMAAKGLWTSPGGKTPHATLYAAMTREIAAKGKDARFRKVERGHFEYAGGGR